MMFWLGAILAVVGSLLYFFAKRGFLVGTHPFCAKCNFNLTGLPKGRERCPECGADILGDHGVRIGHRRPVLPAMLAGAVLAAVGLLLFAATLPAWWARFDGSRFKPVSVLQREMVAPAGAKRKLALTELSRRVASGALSAAQMQQLSDQILKLQRDSGTGWDGRWGDLLQLAQRQRGLPGGVWQTYLEQAVQVDVAVRARIRAGGEALPIRVEARLRAGLNYGGFVPGTMTPEVIFSAGVKDLVLRMGSQEVDEYPKLMEWTGMLPVAEEVAGEKSGRLKVTMTLTDAGGTQVRVTREVEVTYEVLAAGESSVARHPPTAAAEIAEMQTAVKWRLLAETLSVKMGETTPIGTLFVAGPPVAGAFRVVLRQGGKGGREWVLGRVLVRANEWGELPLAVKIAGTSTPPVAGEAELVCVPEAELAAGTVDVLEVWGGEVSRKVQIAAE